MRAPLRRPLRALFALLAVATPVVGCRQVLDIPEPVECGSDDACNTPDDPCIAGECVDGACAYSLRPAGTVIDEAEPFDCKSNVCDGNGEVVVAIVPEDVAVDSTPGDCLAPACDASGNAVQAPAEDAPPDTVAGDCSVPACDGQGNVTTAPDDGDLPNMGDTPGDCVSPACENGAVVEAPNDTDAPTDDMPGDCMSPSCDAGNVVQVVNTEDTPAVDIDGDCLAPTCDAGGTLTPDDMDLPTSGCGSCSGGVVVPWAEAGMACYTGPSGTQNVGICVGGTWACENNVQVCSGEQTPLQEACGTGASGINEDCDAQTDEEGPGCNCMLGQTQSCYTGPGGTLNVGICQAGTSTCQATMMGNQYGACVGDVVPQACDSCLVSGDQDCSGSSATCSGDHVWSKDVGGTESDLGLDVLELPNGEILVAGSFSGTLMSGTSVTSDGGVDGILLRFDDEGNAINAKDFGGTGGDAAKQVVLLDDGYLLMGSLGDGSSENFGSGATLTGVGSDGFLVKFNSSHQVVWKKLVGGNTNDSISAVVRMPDNGVAIAGQFTGTINLGGSNLTSLGFDDIFVARFDAAGNHVWSKRFGTNMQNNVSDLAVASNGDLVIVGDLGTSMSFGGPTINVAGGIDGYVVRMDQNGNHLWTRAFQSAGNEYAQQVVVLSDGAVWVGGKFNTAVDLNGTAGTEISPTSTGYDILAVKYDAAGSYLTSKAINGTLDVSVKAMGVGADNGVILAGGYTGTLFFATLSLGSFGSSDTFIYKINPNSGSTIWWKKPGDTGGDYLYGVRVASCGDVFATGYFTGAVNFGGGDLPNQGGNDIVVVKYRQ